MTSKRKKRRERKERKADIQHYKKKEVRENGKKTESIAMKGAIKEIEKMIKDYKKMKADDKPPLPESVQ